MDLKQLKANFQLAQMKVNVAPTEDNKTLLSQAKEAYEKAKSEIPAKSEDVKIEQVSTDSAQDALLKALQQSGNHTDLLQMIQDSLNPDKKAVKTPAKPVVKETAKIEPAVQTQQPSQKSEENPETEKPGTEEQPSEEKKTE